MNIIRTSLRTQSLRNINTPRIHFIESSSQNCFSTNAPPPLPGLSPDSLNQNLGSGASYGILNGSIRNALRSDIVNLLEGCELSLHDVKTVYSPNFTPTSILVKFSSPEAFDKGMKLIMKENFYQLKKVDQARWKGAKDYGAKTLLLEGIPRTAQQDEVERFLSGCEYDAANMIMFTRQALPEPMKAAIIPMISSIQANNAFLAKNRSYIANNQVLVRVLQ